MVVIKLGSGPTLEGSVPDCDCDAAVESMQPDIDAVEHLVVVVDDVAVVLLLLLIIMVLLVQEAAKIVLDAI